MSETTSSVPRVGWIASIAALALGLALLRGGQDSAFGALQTLAGAAGAAFGAVNLLGQLAGLVLKDGAARDRIGSRVMGVNLGLATVACFLFAAYAGQRAAVHLAPFRALQGEVASVDSRIGRGTFLHVRLKGSDESLDWSCYVACEERAALRTLTGATVKLQLMGRDLAGVETGGRTILDAADSRRIALTQDAVGGLLGVIGGVLCARRLPSLLRARAAT